MASVNFVPYQDPENVSNPEAERAPMKHRVQAKSFMQDNLTQATPRKALGDVKNFKVHQSGSTIKASQQSARKLKPSHHSNLNISSLQSNGSHVSKQIKPSFSAKKDQKNEFKVYQETLVEDDEKLAYKEKEIMFPFKDEDFEFELPEYLNSVLHGNMKRSLWWPSFDHSIEKSKGPSYDFDISNLKLDDLPSREDMQEPICSALPDEITSLECPMFNSLDFETDSFLSLQELEKDLDDIDSFCQF